MTVELLEEDREFTVNIADLHDIEETDFRLVELARQSRPIDWAHVEDLVNSDISKWDPILITKTSIGYVLLGGYHRREAAKKKKRPQVTALNAVCKTFKAERDVINAVFEDNTRQGLKPSAQTRSDHAYFLWTAYPGAFTHKEIALKCGISRSGVSHAIARKSPTPTTEAEAPEAETSPEAKAPEEKPKAKEPGAITEEAREEAGIPSVIQPGTQPAEEARRKAIEKATFTLSDTTQELSRLLQDVQQDTLRAAGITSTLEIVRRALLEATTVVDDVLQRSQEKAPEEQ